MTGTNDITGSAHVFSHRHGIASTSERELYSIVRKCNRDNKIEFDISETMALLEESGYRVLEGESCDHPTNDFVRINGGVINYTTGKEIRNFVLNYVTKSTKDKDIEEFLLNNISTLISNRKLKQLKTIEDNFGTPEKNVQYLNFENGRVAITSETITPGLPFHNTWRQEVAQRKFKRVQIIESICFENGKWRITPTSDGKKCEFLQYLINTSNMYSRYDKKHIATENEEHNFSQHIINKLTAIGYLLCDYKFSSEMKAVVLHERSASNKNIGYSEAISSPFITAIKSIVPTIIIDGEKNCQNENYYRDANRFTKVIVIDDIKENFKIDNLFYNIKWGLKVKNKKARDFEINPKFIITTRHPIRNEEEPSILRRIIHIKVSHWSNDKFIPENKFEHQLFKEWDDEQWCLFDNLMAECVMLYLRSQKQVWVSRGIGVVPAPKEDTKSCTKNREIPEIFFKWAEEYFSSNSKHFDIQLNKKDILRSLNDFANGNTFGVTSRNLSTHLKTYCRIKNYDFNVNKQNAEGLCYLDFKKLHPDDIFFGKRDNRNSNEYYTIHRPKQ